MSMNSKKDVVEVASHDLFEDFVDCPVCDGSKISRVTNQSCTRCEGTGQITRKLSDALAGIRRDLTARVHPAND